MAAFAASMTAFYGTERAARRFLSLAMLLRLSLVFPDQAPSRLALAMRSGSLRRLKRWARSESPAGDDVGAALEQVLTLATALQVHDRRTRGHCERVRALTDLLAEEMGITGPDADRLRWAALLHDIGKISVPASLLNKPGAPDEREWQILRTHPSEARRIASSVYPWLGEWSGALDSHHERWDGTGYPIGLRGEDIPRAARIVAVADAFETMTTVRSYKKPMSADVGREELVRCAGAHFDPAVVRSFLSLSIPRLKRTLGFVAWLAQVPIIGTLPRAAAQVAAGTTAAGAASPQAIAIGTMAVGLVAPSAAIAAPVAHHAFTRPMSTSETPGMEVESFSPERDGAVASAPDVVGAADEVVAVAQPPADDAGPHDEPAPQDLGIDPERADAPTDASPDPGGGRSDEAAGERRGSEAPRPPAPETVRGAPGSGADSRPATPPSVAPDSAGPPEHVQPPAAKPGAGASLLTPPVPAQPAAVQPATGPPEAPDTTPGPPAGIETGKPAGAGPKKPA